MTDNKNDIAQLVVLGGGPGGYAAAFHAADLGMEVTLVDPAPNPGGVCLYRGCIPSKALLHVAKLLNETAESSAWGITFERPKIDLDKLRSWKEGVVNQLTGGLGQLTKQRKIRHIRGVGRFKDANTLQIEPAQGAGADAFQGELKFEKCIIATGSQPATIPTINMASPAIWNSTGALALSEIPARLLVIGGGYIGLELGQVYATLGSEVTVVEMMDSLLPGADKDLIKPLKQRVEKQFAAIHLKTKVTSVKEGADGVTVTLEGADGATQDLTVDRVLVSIGRRPNTRDIGLDKAGIELDQRGFIPVDLQRRTTVEHLFAIGDVTGDPMLAHKASHEGRVAVEAAMGQKTAFEPIAIPAVVFTDPEIAWTGITEPQAKEQGLNYTATRFPWPASGRALTMDRTDGLTKLICDADTGRVLGVGLVGTGSGEMIAEGTLAIEMGATAEDLALTIHAHPTLSETIMEAAELFHGPATHLYRPPKKKG